MTTPATGVALASLEPTVKLLFLKTTVDPFTSVPTLAALVVVTATLVLIVNTVDTSPAPVTNQVPSKLAMPELAIVILSPVLIPKLLLVFVNTTELFAANVLLVAALR